MSISNEGIQKILQGNRRFFAGFPIFFWCLPIANSCLCFGLYGVPDLKNAQKSKTPRFLLCPKLYGQHKKNPYGIEFKNTKKHTDFVFRAESVLFLFEYVRCCKNECTHL